MKYQIMLGILFTLLAKRKVSAGYLASRYDVSVRSVYRYIDEMTVAGIPIDVARGSQGGIYISDAFKLPKGLMTKEEYGRAIDAMLAMNEQLSDPVLASAIAKLSAQVKSEQKDLTLSGNILVDSGTWGDTQRFSEKLALVERAVEEKEALDIDYISREGERTQRRILPHLLVYKQNIWYVYAFCRKREAFRLFKLGRMRSLLRTGEYFEALPFRREDIIRFLEEKGVGLYDTACAVRRTKNTASDKDLEIVTPTDLDALLRRIPSCVAVVTTGQKATDVFTSHFDMRQPKVGTSAEFTFDGRPMRLYRMPSSSRAYPMKVEAKAGYYEKMFVETGLKD